MASTMVRARGLLLIVASMLACGDDADDASADAGVAELRAQLQRIEARLAAMEQRQASTPSPNASSSDVDDPFAARDDPPSSPDAIPRGKSLRLTVTSAGWRVDDREIDAAQLEILLHGVGSVTVHAHGDAPHASVDKLLDLLREADIRHIAIARSEPP